MEIKLQPSWHHLPLSEVEKDLKTSQEHGLSLFDVKHRQQQFGPNRVASRPAKSPLIRFLAQFNQPLIYILLAAGLFTLVLQEWSDSSFIFGVVLINAVVGFLQEAKAESAIAALKSMVLTNATVIRESRKDTIVSEELVPGDLVLLQSGDKIPADLRLFWTKDLQIDESMLTGESAPVHKTSDVQAEELVLADRRNMAYAGNLVTYGQARGWVTAIGEQTETGKIAHLISTAADLSTPLTRKIEHFSKILLYAILALAVLVVVVGLLRREPLVEMVMAAIALAVSAIPEGLPAVVTITLALGVRRMARQRAIIRKLPAVETLGSTTVICSDKTGTLTENQMTVTRIRVADRLYHISGVGYDPRGSFQLEGAEAVSGQDPVLEQCLLAGVLCNDSRLVQEKDRWSVQGDPTEAALLVSGLKAGWSLEKALLAYPRLDVIPFESQRQYMASLHRSDQGPAIMYLKGSVEKILTLCSHELSTGGTRPLDKERIQRATDELASQGLRVLAFATGRLDCSDFCTGELLEGLTFIGLQAMIDPPRPEARQAVALCRTAGIRVKMITGDHAVTAKAVALDLGLQDATDGPLEVETGARLEQYSDPELIEVAERTAVFARVAPDQKLRLVDALQSRGHVVAMTGDGVNDAPALKQADIGVAMGMNGTEVSKEAADMILLDDNFATIAKAVEQGRSVFDNLTKFILWTLPTNLGQALLILIAVFMGLDLPILPIHILYINMTTALFLGLMLAFEPVESGLMNRPPRPPRAPILTSELVGRMFLVAAFLVIGGFGLYEWELALGQSVQTARTAVVTVAVFGGIFYLFNCRSLTRSVWSLGVFSNRPLFAGVLLMVLCHIAFIYVPAFNRVFHSAPIDFRTWAAVIGVGAATFSAVGFEKWIRYRGSLKI